MNEESCKKKKRKIKVNSLIKLSVSIIVLIISIICFMYINKLAILPNKYLYLVLAIILILNMISMFLLFCKGIIKNIISGILYSLLLIISIFGIKYSGNTIEYLNEGFSNNEIEYTTYNVIVLKDSSFASLTDLQNTDMGYLFIEIDNDEYLKEVKKQVNTELKQLDVYELYNQLVKKEIESILINDAYISLMEEEIENFSEKTRILHTFDVETKNEINTEKID